MRNFLIFIVCMVLVGKFGSDYLVSDDFQNYANRTKAPWTCEFENTMGHLNMVMSDYQRALIYFGHTIKRCPNSEYMQEAEFESARCAEGIGQHRQASQMYSAFAEKYPGTKRARIANQAADLLRTN